MPTHPTKTVQQLKVNTNITTMKIHFSDLSATAAMFISSHTGLISPQCIIWSPVNAVSWYANKSRQLIQPSGKHKTWQDYHLISVVINRWYRCQSIRLTSRSIPDEKWTGNNTCLLLTTNELQQPADCWDDTAQISVTAQRHMRRLSNNTNVFIINPFTASLFRQRWVEKHLTINHCPAILIPSYQSFKLPA